MVPFEARGRAVGVVQGGILNVTRRHLPLRTTPGKIPVIIEVDVTELELHQGISVRDIPFPEGVTCTLKPELTLAVVVEPRRVVEEETVAAEGEEGAEGAEGAPAAEGDAAAAAGAGDAAGGEEKKSDG